MTLHITVTADNIRETTSQSFYHCPIARAISDTPFAKERRLGLISVGANYGTLQRSASTEGAYKFDLSEDAKAFIAVWDTDRRAAKPFEFDVELEPWIPSYCPQDWPADKPLVSSALDAGRIEWAENKCRADLSAAEAELK